MVEDMLPARLDDVQNEETKEVRRLVDFEQLARKGLQEVQLPLMQIGIILKFMKLNEDGTVVLSGYAETIAKKIEIMGALLRPIVGMKRALSASSLRGAHEEERVPQAFKVAHDLNNMMVPLGGNVELSMLSPINRKRYIDLAWSVYLLAEGILIEGIDASQKKAQNLAQVRRNLVRSLASFQGALVEGIPTNRLEERVGLSTGDLGRLVFDLLDNAKKNGAARVDITVRCEERGLLILIKDNGCGFGGVDPLEAARLSHERDPHHGNGIGICKGLCESAGGTLTLSDANDPTGAQWEIRLPFLVDQR